jgi:hypothetical protein
MTSRPNCPVAPVTTILSEIVMFLLLVYNLGQALNKRPCDIAEGGRCDWSTRRMLSSFSDAGYLMPRLPHPRSCFFEQPELQRLLDDNPFSSCACRRRSLTSLLVAARAVSPESRRLPASRNSFLGHGEVR